MHKIWQDDWTIIATAAVVVILSDRQFLLKKEKEKREICFCLLLQSIEINVSASVNRSNQISEQAVRSSPVTAKSRAILDFASL